MNKQKQILTNYSYLYTKPSVTRRSLAGAFRVASKILFDYWLSVSVIGHIPKNQFIICSNHNSHLDTAILMHVFKQPFLNYGLLAAYDYWFDTKGFFKKLVCQSLFLIPLDRKKTKSNRGINFQSTLKLCKLFLDSESKYLIVYPEGSRHINLFEKPIKRGVTLISNYLQLPILPIHISRVELKKRSCKIVVNVGELIYPPNYENKKTGFVKIKSDELSTTLKNLAQDYGK